MRKAVLGMALATLLAPRLARAGGAAELPLKLTWEAPAGCPTAEDVTRRVRHLLSATLPERTTVIANARVRPSAPGRLELVLTTEVGDARGTKTLAATSCSALAETTAVFLALAIDAIKETPAEPASTPTPTPTSTPEPIAPPDAESEPRAAESEPPIAPRRGAERPPRPLPRRASEPIRVGFGAVSVLDVGTLPDPALGIGANVHLRLDRFRVGALGTLWHRQAPTFNEASGAGAAFDMRTLGVFGCYALPLGPVAVGPCVDVAATSVEATGRGIKNPRAVHSIWPTVATGLRADGRLTSWLSVTARLDLLTAIASPEVALATENGPLRLYDRGIFSMRSGLGLEIVLP